eukprot:1094366-Pyramimonas_sp.AAC.1
MVFSRIRKGASASIFETRGCGTTCFNLLPGALNLASSRNLALVEDVRLRARASSNARPIWRQHARKGAR